MHPFPVILGLALGAGAVCAQTDVPNANPDPFAGAAAVTAPSPAAGRLGGAAEAGSALSILVYDNDTHHSLAANAAMSLSPAGTTIADTVNFNSLLTSGTWDAVAVDCPSTIPSGGWSTLIDYVNSGGAVILSYWDWDNTGGAATGLAAAFDVSLVSTISLFGKTLTNGDTSPAFLDVTEPVSSWHDHWSDDGDQFSLFAGAHSVAHIGTASTPVMVRGNAGKTIAAPVLDEVGDSWLLDGSGVQLWKNMMLMVGTSNTPRVLVYDHDTLLHMAQIAAFEEHPGGTYVGGISTFYSLLASGPWDAVLLDAPDTDPGLWTDLINYVNGGGHVALSYWDWDASTPSAGDPALPGAFDASVVSSLDWTGLSLIDSGTSDLFAGVTMPNPSWGTVYFDDGDRFTPLGPGAQGVAHAGNPAEPVIVYGNSGRTLAAPVLDEAGLDWFPDGVQLWKNMLGFISGPQASSTPRSGILGLNPNDYTCIAPPVVGGLWIADVDTTPTKGITTITTFVTIGAGGPTQGIPIFGHELLILPPFLETVGFGTHNIPVSPNPLLVGLSLPSQGARLEVTGPTVYVILTNGQDLVFGF